METKLTVRVQRHLLENAKRYARENNTTLTELISVFLQNISNDKELSEHAPIVSRLTGILSTDISVDDYKRYLEEKYSGR